jgi:hypothetical protein
MANFVSIEALHVSIGREATFSRRDAPEVCMNVAPKKKREQGKPGARCTRGLMCKADSENAHEHTGSAEAVRLSLRNGFNGFLRALPGDQALLTPSPCGSWRIADPVGRMHLHKT